MTMILWSMHSCCIICFSEVMCAHKQFSGMWGSLSVVEGGRGEFLMAKEGSKTQKDWSLAWWGRDHLSGASQGFLGIKRSSFWGLLHEFLLRWIYTFESFHGEEGEGEKENSESTYNQDSWLVCALPWTSLCISTDWELGSSGCFGALPRPTSSVDGGIALIWSALTSVA